MQDYEYEAIAKRLGYGMDARHAMELERRGCEITVYDNGKRFSVRTPEKPPTALELAIERELVDDKMLEVREAYIELQRAYSAMQAASIASIYTVRGNDGDGEGARRWLLLQAKVASAMPFNLCDWGFWNPPKTGEHLADYAWAFEVIRSGLREVAEEMKDSA